jgi:FtsZ-binding cell division protein ZapB
MTADITTFEKSNIKNQNCGVPACRDDFHNFAFCFLHFYFPLFLIPVFCLLVLTSCNRNEKEAQLLEEVQQLKDENSKLASRIEQSESQKKVLQKRVQVLSSLPEEVKSESLYTLEQIKLGRFTDFFDKDHDGKKETLIVYIQTIDDQGDKVKAIGTAQVELWDLDKPDGQAMLGSWKRGPQELKKLWYATMFTINYRLTFDIAEIVEDFDKSYTLKVKFTDYMSGQTFEDQKVIEP